MSKHTPASSRMLGCLKSFISKLSAKNDSNSSFELKSVERINYLKIEERYNSLLIVLMAMFSNFEESDLLISPRKTLPNAPIKYKFAIALYMTIDQNPSPHTVTYTWTYTHTPCTYNITHSHPPCPISSPTVSAVYGTRMEEKIF